MRLIDADALRKKATMRGHCLRPMVTAYNMCVSVHDIDAQPTIDAEPVRHGTWEEIETYAFVGFDGNGSLKERRQKYYRHICGRCSAIKEKFCPNCGVKMDGGGSDGKND